MPLLSRNRPSVGSRAARQAQRLSARRQERLRNIIDQHLPAVWRLLRRMGLDESDAADAVQDVVLIAARKLDAIKPQSERPFMLRTAYRVGARMRARRRPLGDEAMGTAEDPAPHADVLVDQKRARELLDQILARLSVEQRTVFALHDIEGLTMAEIAELLDISPGTTASRLRLARQQFNACVGRIETRMKARGELR